MAYKRKAVRHKQ